MRLVSCSRRYASLTRAVVCRLWPARFVVAAGPAPPGAGLLCAGIAWSAANGWRATFGRIVELERGGSLDHGAAEMWTVSIATTLALICLGLALYLVARADRVVRQS